MGHSASCRAERNCVNVERASSISCFLDVEGIFGMTSEIFEGVWMCNTVIVYGGKILG